MTIVGVLGDINQKSWLCSSAGQSYWLDRTESNLKIARSGGEAETAETNIRNR
jgi:hypothetical protein